MGRKRACQACDRQGWKASGPSCCALFTGVIGYLSASQASGSHLERVRIGIFSLTTTCSLASNSVVNRASGSTARSSKKAEQRTDLPEASSSSTLTRTASSGTDCSQTMSNKQLKTWVQQKFREQTTQAGFKEDAFAKSLVEQKPACKKKIYQFVAV